MGLNYLNIKPKWRQTSKEAGFKRVLTMAYNIQNHCIFVLFPSSGILKTRKQNVGVGGSLVIKTLPYKPEDLGFDSR
jgi:hypothetical protein